MVSGFAIFFWGYQAGDFDFRVRHELSGAPTIQCPSAMCPASNEEWICRSPAMHSQLWPLMNRRAVHRRGFVCLVLLLGGLKNGKHVEVEMNVKILDVIG